MTRQKSDAELKADFLRKKGATKCPSSHEIYAAEAEKFRAPEKKKTAPYIRKEPPIPPAPPLADMGEKPSMLWLSTDELHVNDTYQRGISTGAGRKVIRTIVSEFRWPLFGVLIVTSREGGGAIG